MNKRFVTIEELSRRLTDQGHKLLPISDVGTSPETIFTLAVEPDCVLKPAYRNRYFVSRTDLTGSPTVANEPSLALNKTLSRAIGPLLTENHFLAGPVVWLLARLRRFPLLLLWPSNQYRGKDGLVCKSILTFLPQLQARLIQIQANNNEIGALILDLSSDSDAAIFWEVSRLISGSSEDFYISDEAASEVYNLHHHNKIVVSIPNEHSRWVLLRELKRLPEAFEDWSRYRCESDPDEAPCAN